MRFKGTLTDWNDDRGFGFIQPAGGAPRVFLHVRAFRERGRRPIVGMALTYELSRDEHGRPRAEDARLVRAAKPPPAGAREGTRGNLGIAVTGAGLFLAAIAALAAARLLPWAALAWYAGWSVVLFFVYGLDKASARLGHWRTKEATLNGLALIGGWPGGWIAQQAFRHKSRKVSFQVEFWIAVTVNLAALGYLVYSGADLAALLQR